MILKMMSLPRPALKLKGLTTEIGALVPGVLGHHASPSLAAAAVPWCTSLDAANALGDSAVAAWLAIAYFAMRTPGSVQHPILSHVALAC